MEKDVKEILTEDYPDIEEVLVGFKVKESGEEKESVNETEEKGNASEGVKEIANETEKAAIEAERMIPSESGKKAANRVENETANDTKTVL